LIKLNKRKKSVKKSKMNYIISLFLAVTAIVAANTVIIRKHPEVNVEAVVNEAGTTEVAGNAGVATPRLCGTTRPVNEAVPLCLQKGLPRCQDCEDEHTQLVEKLCNEAKELRTRHELFLASANNNLKGAKGEL
jgi:hypothetical protein